MQNYRTHLANLTGVRCYEARIAFTNRYEPAMISEHGLPFVSLKTEIMANSLSPKAAQLHKIYGRIPYSAPIYLWELHMKKAVEVLYIGQTVLQKVQKRFEVHTSITRLLAQYVNDPLSYVYYRLCSRLDIVFEKAGNRVISAIEHFPLSQARQIIDDIEAYLIYEYKPRFNSQYKNRKKKYWKSFSVIYI
jgi:hypothetical protein